MGFIHRSGYMREDLFQMYLNHFLSSIPPARPVLLMLDGHKSHINYMSVDFLPSKWYPPLRTRYTFYNHRNFSLRNQRENTTKRLLSTTIITMACIIVTKHTFTKVLSLRLTRLLLSAMPTKQREYAHSIPMLLALTVWALR